MLPTYASTMSATSVSGDATEIVAPPLLQLQPVSNRGVSSTQVALVTQIMSPPAPTPPYRAQAEFLAAAEAQAGVEEESDRSHRLETPEEGLSSDVSSAIYL